MRRFRVVVVTSPTGPEITLEMNAENYLAAASRVRNAKILHVYEV